MTAHQSEEIGPPPCTPAAARDAIENARRKVMDLYGGNLDHPALDHLEAALCAVDDIERDRGLAAAKAENERPREALRSATENALLREALRLACEDGWDDGQWAMRRYLKMAQASLSGSPTQEETR